MADRRKWRDMRAEALESDAVRKAYDKELTMNKSGTTYTVSEDGLSLYLTVHRGGQVHRRTFERETGRPWSAEDARYVAGLFESLPARHFPPLLFESTPKRSRLSRLFRRSR